MHEGSAGQSRLFANEYNNARYLRADTPFTSPPLPDDFDAVTQRWSRTTRMTTVEPTASGLLDRLEATTRATTPVVAAFPKSRRRKNHSSHVENERLATVQERTLRRTRREDKIKGSSVDDRTRMGPSAGQDYEMVKVVVLEENSDRTVSISTWREQAIEEADSDQDMSVYFVEPDDYIPLGTGATVEILSRMAEVNLASGSGNERSKASRGDHEEAKNSSADRPNRVDPHYEGTKTYRPAAIPSPHSSAPRTSTPRGSGTLIHDAQGDNSHTAKGSSPFHAKKAESGSTISSIHLTPTLENILTSCEPSLLHILPVLQTVGILGAEHLRAVGKLSEDTRNKEVKEEVLKLGVTVIEWAILLDKLQTL